MCLAARPVAPHRALVVWLGLSPAAAWGAVLEPEAVAPTEPTVATELPAGLLLPELQAPIVVGYPEDLASEPAPPSGVVKLKFLVRTDGRVAGIEVLEGVHPRIDALVVERLGQATYRPATFEGSPVELILRIDVAVEAPPPPPPPFPPAATLEVPEPEPVPTPTPTIVGPVRISGVLLEGGDRRPIAGARVTALPAGNLPLGRVSRREQTELAKDESPPSWSAATTTDADGRFALRDVQDGNVRLVFTVPGYERIDRVVELSAGEAIDAKFFLTVAHETMYRTVVEAHRNEVEELTRRRLPAAQLAVMPGTGGDAIKGILNLPGVARTPFGLGDLLLRGAGPGDSIALIGHHEVPLAFHFFGATSVVPTVMLESVDMIPSSFDARFGDAIGGVVDVRFRKGRTDRVHGEIFADVVNAGAMLEVPVGKGWIMGGARRSYFGNVIALFDPSFFVAPRYWDYQGMFGYPIGKGELVLRAFGSDDVMAGVGDDVDDSFDFQLGFHRADLEYAGQQGAWSYLLTGGYRRVGQRAQFAANDTIDLQVDSGLWRAEVTWKPRRWVSWQLGSQGEGSSYGLDLISKPFDQEGTGETLHSQRRGTLVTAGFYSSATFATRSGFSVTPAVRVNGFITPSDRWIVDPRLRAKWTFTSGTTVKVGGGLYSQVASPEYWIEDFGNPDLRPERAWHLSAGVEQTLPYDFTIEATGFMRQSWDVAMPSDAIRVVDGETIPVNAENSGSGRAYGGEFIVKRDFAKNVSGWVAYTLMRSELRERPGEDYQLASWDQTHNLILIAHWRLPRNWSLGLRFRLVSGNLITPITDGVLESGTGNYVPVPGPENSERLPLFHQLDLRIDKSWTIRAAKVSVYLDVQNIYNAKNTEFVQPSFDFKNHVRVRSLPVVPSFGLKVSF